MCDLYELFSVDYMIDINSIKITRLFNEHFADVTEHEIVGIRGYWVGNQMLYFNVSQIIIDMHRSFEPFKSIQLIKTSTLRGDDDLPHVVAYDMLRTFPEYNIRFYNNVHHVPRASRLKFATESISAYLAAREQEGKDSLKQKIFSSTAFALEKLEYKTSINVDTEATDFDMLNNIMIDRKMEILEGSGSWSSPSVFNISKLVFRQSSELPRIVGIERSFKKVAQNPKHIVLSLSQPPLIDYPTLAPNLFSNYPYVMLVLDR